MQLPPKTVKFVLVPMPEVQAQCYNAVEHMWRSSSRTSAAVADDNTTPQCFVTIPRVDADVGEDSSVGRSTMSLRRAANHPLLCRMHYTDPVVLSIAHMYFHLCDLIDDELDDDDLVDKPHSALHSASQGSIERIERSHRAGIDAPTDELSSGPELIERVSLGPHPVEGSTLSMDRQALLAWARGNEELANCAEELLLMTDFEIHSFCSKYTALAPYVLPEQTFLESGKARYAQLGVGVCACTVRFALTLACQRGEENSCPGNAQQ